ncbi:Flavinator of succinate dehydrogenase-domain-containing protein [Cokeromyces recurvatus]|uniref:Flavinator of succinate dehydrogenase-domain-containing protein n=1 Tax=Cokeromyces recurvatus TaxID=90255 RepID=UPI00221E42FB|nr:Flavinator of succinate dehydrogenase-domain-containing protein [Cokeromyces recurvatus]KAI7899249.1 Flavinator of succinate dehydrogenase-domain-containing protein [Cokeromyces recurvatus]
MLRFNIRKINPVISQTRALSILQPSCTKHSHGGDPFPNLAIRHSTALDTSYPNLPPIPRPNESTENKRRRLIYQSRKRGILETDLLLSTFAKTWLPQFDRDQLDEYDRLLDEPDWDIFYWATHKKPVPERWQKSKVLEMVSDHARNDEKKVLRMPDLEA